MRSFGRSNSGLVLRNAVSCHLSTQAKTRIPIDTLPLISQTATIRSTTMQRQWLHPTATCSVMATTASSVVLASGFRPMFPQRLHLVLSSRTTTMATKAAIRTFWPFYRALDSWPASDSAAMRSLPVPMGYAGSLTPEKCIDSCSSQGYELAGVEYAVVRKLLLSTHDPPLT